MASRVPAIPDNSTMAGNGTLKNCPRMNAAPAKTYNAPCFRDFFDRRKSASTTMATTAAEMPWNMPETAGTWPLAAASHARTSIRTIDGSRKHIPAIKPPR